MLSVLEGNSSKAEIVTNEKDKIEMKIAIESEKSDTEGIQEIKELLNEKNNLSKKYSIKFNYSDEGFINEAVITYTKK